jgi:cell division septation protein DedD
MKKTLLAIAFSSTLLFSSSINNKYQPYQSTITVGKNSFAKDSKMRDSTVFGIRATAYDGDIFRYGLQLGYECAIDTKYDEVESTSSTTKTDMHRLFVNMLVDGEEEYNVVPYLLFGLGYEYLSDELYKQDVSQGFAQTGLGFKYNITRSLNLALEGRVLGKFDTRDVDFIFSGGLGYMFGNNTSSKKIIGFNSSKKKNPVPSTSKRPSSIVVPSLVNNVSTTPKEINEREVVYSDEQNIDLSMTVAPTVEVKPASIKTKKIDLVENSREMVVFDDFESTKNLEEVVFEEDRAKNNTPHVNQSYSNQGQFYVQMEAYRNRYSGGIVSKLRNSGYNNTLIHTSASSGRDLHRVLVGPYLTKNSARKVQKKLKRINPQAFIYKMD